MATNAMLDQSEKMRAAAKLLSRSADAMADARNKAMASTPPAIRPGEFSLCILRENLMRDAVNKILLQAIDSAVKGVQGAQADLEQAIADATALIQKVANVMKALSVFASLIGLAESIIVGDPGGILTALGGVKDAAAGA